MIVGEQVEVDNDLRHDARESSAGQVGAAGVTGHLLEVFCVHLGVDVRVVGHLACHKQSVHHLHHLPLKDTTYLLPSQLVHDNSTFTRVQETVYQK